MRARRMAACLLAAAALGIGATGCGDDEEAAAPAPATTPPASTDTTPSQSGEGILQPADATRGKVVFTANCAGCHTLMDAAATGGVGPNLDDLKPDESTVGFQVERGGGSMPSFEGKLSQQEINDVAKYVSSVAGQ